MKITGVETIALADPGRATETVVRVHTDEGISGIGQAETPSLVVDAIVRCEGGLEQTLRGEDPLQVERLWQKMYAATGLFGRRGVTISVIGAVETALWDVAGKALGKPVCELLWRSACVPSLDILEVAVTREGGERKDGQIRRKVVPYATVYPPGASRREVEERFGRAVARGFRAVKLEAWPGGLGYGDARQDAGIVKTVRQVIGDERQLMLDLCNLWRDAPQAIESVRAVEESGVFFVEAPLHPDSLEAYARLADAVDTRIAVGDWGFAGRFDFEEIMTRGRVDVVQPSSVRAGGMSEIMKIGEAAYRRGLLCVPHAWCHMIGVAAEVHLAAVLPNAPFIEYPIAFPDSPLISQLLDPPLAPDEDGLIEVPRRPGLGFALNEKVVERHRVKPF